MRVNVPRLGHRDLGTAKKLYERRCAKDPAWRTIDSTAEELTIKTVLDHMTAMEQRLSGRFEGVETLLTGVEKAVTGLSCRMDGIGQKLQAVETNLSRQIDGIDQKLPGRVKSLEAGIAH